MPKFARFKAAVMSAPAAVRNTMIIAGVSMMMSPAAFAIDDAVLQTTMDSGKTSYALVVAGVITAAAAGFCLAMIMGLIKR